MEKSRIIKLGEVCQTINGLWKGKKPPFQRVAVIRNTNFTKDCVLDYSDIAYLDVECKQYAARKLFPNDLIVERSGGSEKQAVGRVVLFNREGEFSFSNFTSCLRVKNTNLLLPKYLYRYLVYLYQLGITKALQSNTTGIRNLDFTKYKQLEVPIPSLINQRYVLQILDKTEKLIHFQKKRLEELDNLVQSVFYEMFGDPVKNEKEWKLDFLNNHLEVVGGYAFKSKEYCENGIPLIRIGNINTGHFNILNMVFVIEKPELKRYILEPGDLLISMTGTVGKEDYGNVCILDDSYTRYYLNQRNAKLKCRGQLNKWYVYFVLKNSQIKKKLTGISRGVRQANISNRDINSLLIPLPPLSLQTRFAAIVEKIEQQKALVKKALQESEDLFQRLMQDLFRPDQENEN